MGAAGSTGAAGSGAPGSNPLPGAGSAGGFSYAGPVLDLPPADQSGPAAHESERDWAIAEGTVRWARDQRLDLLPVGEVTAFIGTTFVGAPYEPGSLELPGAEGLVVNLQVFDCVTFVEHALVLARLTVFGPDPDDRSAFRDAYRTELTRLRYRNGVLDGYTSRLHYFSEWIRDGAARGLVRDVSSELGGIPDPRSIDFMSTHPASYRQLAEDPALLPEIRAMEARISAVERRFIPKEAIAATESGIQNGDIIAAVSTVPGLDIAHTGIALWHDGRLHLLHAPLVGDVVEISPLPLAERIQRISGQRGIMVARPLEPEGRPEPGSGAGPAIHPPPPGR